MTNMTNHRISGERLWQSLMDMAVIGATKKGGSKRLALDDLDREGRDLFVSWCEKLGCTVKVDQIGNIFADCNCLTVKGLRNKTTLPRVL